MAKRQFSTSDMNPSEHFRDLCVFRRFISCLVPASNPGHVHHCGRADLPAVKKDYEPAPLPPIGFGAIPANLPPMLMAGGGTAVAAVLGTAEEPGFLRVLFDAGIANELFPVLILPLACCAMIDFHPC